mmetsp:Transcript_155157/g.282118  ORF Transcript_155157/g.282118 Transcript_155157/m.282118 type:complete len:226 (+) Transcript_155157:865-1542(+)
MMTVTCPEASSTSDCSSYTGGRQWPMSGTEAWDDWVDGSVYKPITSFAAGWKRGARFNFHRSVTLAPSTARPVYVVAFKPTFSDAAFPGRTTSANVESVRETVGGLGSATVIVVEAMVTSFPDGESGAGSLDLDGAGDGYGITAFSFGKRTSLRAMSPKVTSSSSLGTSNLADTVPYCATSEIGIRTGSTDLPEDPLFQLTSIANEDDPSSTMAYSSPPALRFRR